MKKIGIIIFIVAIIIGIAISSIFSFGDYVIKSPINVSIFNKIKGSGNFVTEKREVGEFNNVKVGGIFQVEIVAQKDFGVEVDADDNLLNLITTEVNDETLIIKSKEKFSTKNPVRIRISAENIEALDISGVSKVNISNLDNQSFKIEASGASKVSLEGRTKHLDLDISGASRIESRELEVSKVSIDGSGASRANVNVLSTLSADLSGASKVRYSGNPQKIIKKTSGAGSLKQLD